MSVDRHGIKRDKIPGIGTNQLSSKSEVNQIIEDIQASEESQVSKIDQSLHESSLFEKVAEPFFEDQIAEEAQIIEDSKCRQGKQCCRWNKPSIR